MKLKFNYFVYRESLQRALRSQLALMISRENLIGNDAFAPTQVSSFKALEQSPQDHNYVHLADCHNNPSEV